MIVRKPSYPRVPEAIARVFSAEGLTLVGITSTPESDAEAEREEASYRAWLAKGYAGSMGYLSDHAPLKFRPRAIMPGCKSILFGALNYYQRPAMPESGGPRGRIARYAWGRDYHRALGGRLRRIARRLGAEMPSERFRHFTDATPLAERFYAERAGIGFTGRNTLLISGQYGSWFLVGEILSTHGFPPSDPAGRSHGACPSSCRKCLDVCPTGALVSAGEIDASRCISYLTIEHKASIPVELREKMGNWLFGCDLCQEVCPLNVRAQVTDVADFLAVRAGESLTLEEVLSIPDDAAFAARFAGTPLMRPGRRLMIRNACVVAGNVRDRALAPLLERHARGTDALIAEHAAWALARIALAPQE